MDHSLFKRFILIRYHFLILICFLSILSAKSGSISIGLNDKLGFYGGISRTWITEKDYGESYTIVGTTLLLIGGVGYGQKYYITKGIVSPYASLTSFGYYILPMSENAAGPEGSIGISANLGVDMNIISWKKYTIILQFGLFTASDILTGQSLIISGGGGPSFLMPSFNIKVSFD